MSIPPALAVKLLPTATGRGGTATCDDEDPIFSTAVEAPDTLGDEDQDEDDAEH